MKKKVLTFILSICFIISAMFCLSACSVTSADIKFKVENGYIQYYDGETWCNLISIHALKGEDGDIWTIGTDGYWYKNGTKTDNKAVGQNGESGNGIKSIAPSTDPAKTTDTQTTYIITLDNGDTYEFVVKNGTNGDDGTNGDQYTIGTDGYWYKNGVKTEYKAVGEDGANADVWTIGTDGYWYKNGTKSDNKAIGLDGKDATYKTYTVTFDYNDDEFKNAVGQTVSEYFGYSLEETLNYSCWLGDKMPTFKNTVLNDYFDGWVVKDSDIVVTEYDVIGGNVTLQAKWKYNFAVIFRSNLPESWFHNECIYASGQDKIDSSVRILYVPALYVDSNNKIQKVTQLGKYNANCMDLVNIEKVYIAAGIKIIKDPFVGYSDIDIYFPDNFVSMPSYYSDQTYRWAFSFYGGVINFHFTNIENFFDSIGTNTSTARDYGRYNLYVNEKIITKLDSSYKCSSSFIAALSGCESLEVLNFDETITKVNDEAFLAMGNLKSVTFEASKVTIGWRTFSDCQELRKVSIPNGTIEIGGYAFSGCEKLESIDAAFGIEKFDSYAFDGCINLRTIKLSDNIKEISEITETPDLGCGVEEIVITSNVVTIQSRAFVYCDYLTNVTIESAAVYNKYATADSDTYLLKNALVVKVLKSVVDDAENTNEFLNNTENFNKLSSGQYYIYTKVENS